MCVCVCVGGGGGGGGGGGVGVDVVCGMLVLESLLGSKPHIIVCLSYK